MGEEDNMATDIVALAANGEETGLEETDGEDQAAVGDPALASGEGPEFKWYIAKTMTGQENKVSRSLREKIIQLEKATLFSRILVPEETVVSNAGGKKRNIRKKFFPGYILIKMVMNDDTWHLVNSVGKIAGFVGGTPTRPQPISEEEAAYMTNQLGEGAVRSRTSAHFSEGEQVKVVEGPFASFVGTVEAVNEKGRLKVNVLIFGRPTPVELDFAQVEKVS